MSLFLPLFAPVVICIARFLLSYCEPHHLIHPPTLPVLCALRHLYRLLSPVQIMLILVACVKDLNRVIFLETVAGIPGMVAGTLRHLTSLRRMRRYNVLSCGWVYSELPACVAFLNAPCVYLALPPG